VKISDARKQGRIFIDKDALPRHDDIIENERSVDFVKPCRQRMTFRIGMLRLEVAADDFQSRRVHRNRKSDRIIDFLRFARPIRLYQYFVGNRR
jgi:hypothetical protein